MIKTIFFRSITPLLAFLLTVIFLSAHSAEAFWVWTPGSKMPVNPKNAPRDTPENQFKWAMDFFNSHDYKRSAEEFKSLVKAFKESDLAPEAQYYAGRSYEELGKYYFAYEEYQKTIENYPFSKRYKEIIERQFNIANIFREKASPKLMDLELNDALGKAVEIYKKIVDNSSFGELADKSLFYAAECYRRSKQYNEAISTYERLINDYPNSPLAAEAKLELAETTYEASLDPDYDQEITDEALQKYEKIAKNTAVPKIASDADKAIMVLKNRKAESVMKIAEFYEKQKKYNSAMVYYKDVVSTYPSTQIAELAKYKITSLEAKVKK
ncbi:MAG: outer membrane protein assembly factor BamD [Candidatus Omnitrophica bacterium]|nr:outer membrane protein assembly factor BamD [Candidatus Omnitrophota bacterium]